MKVPLKVKASKTFSPDATQRAMIMLEATVNDDYRRMAEVLKAINSTADDRGGRIKMYVDEAKDFYKEMKEIAGG